jgi:DDE superfamily endonuclease
MSRGATSLVRWSHDQVPSLPTRPRPAEDYAAQFDALFARRAQRRGLRTYLQGLLLPRDRNKTLTALVGAQHAAVQGLQFFLSESSWEAEQLNQRRLELLGGGLPPPRGPRGGDDQPAGRPRPAGSCRGRSRCAGCAAG